MKTKKLIILTSLIVLVGILLFAYFYMMRQSPLAFAQPEPSINPVVPPNFLYAINNDPKHPLDRPMAVLVANRNIYVSDYATSQVSVYDYNGKFEHYLVPGKNGFKRPYGLAYDGSNIYVADTELGRIMVFNGADKFTGLLPTPKAALAGPAAVVYSAGKLYVSDVQRHKVFAFDTSGKLLTTYGDQQKSVAALKYPHGIAVDSKGTVYVADSGNNRIVVFHADGSLANTIGADSGSGHVLTPRGLSLDAHGDLWVVSGLANVVQVFRVNGDELMEFGGNGQEYGELSLPNGIFIDAQNRIYITETGNSRVSVFSY